MSRNDITGDTIATRPYSEAYGEGHDRIWGKKEKTVWNCMECWPKMCRCKRDAPDDVQPEPTA